MKKILVILILLFLTASLHAESASSDDPYDPYDIAVMIVGRDKKMYAWWGHIGFIVHDRRNGSQYLYDYGNFSFDSEDFFKNYAFGRMEYLMMRMPAQRYYEHIISQDRDIDLLWLNLSPGKEREIVDYLKWNSLPDNRTYLYHNIVNNCSTKIRDILDEHLAGQLYDATGFYDGETIRSLARLYTKDYFFGDLLITFVHADYTDREITRWEEMYIPIFLEDALMDFEYENQKGEMVPLVSKVEILHASQTYEPLPEEVGPRWIKGLLIGLLIGIFFLSLSLFAEKRKWVSRIYNLFQILFSLSLAIPGSLLLFMMFFTDHDYSYGNVNVLIVNPLLLAAPVFILLAGRGREKPQKILDITWFVLAIIAALLLILELTGLIMQNSIIIIMLTLPVFIALSGPAKKAAGKLLKRKN